MKPATTPTFASFYLTDLDDVERDLSVGPAEIAAQTITDMIAELRWRRHGAPDLSPSTKRPYEPPRIVRTGHVDDLPPATRQSLMGELSQSPDPDPDIVATILDLGRRIDDHRRRQAPTPYRLDGRAPLPTVWCAEDLDPHGHPWIKPTHHELHIEARDLLHPDVPGWTVFLGPAEAQPVGCAPTLGEALKNLRDNLTILVADL